MLLWLLLLIWTPGRGQSGVAPKAVLLLEPPWSTTFKGEKVTLTCRESHSLAQGNTIWYRDMKPWRVRANKIQITESGNYQCKTQGSSLSDAVHVEFSSDWLILQASHPVFEGDDVTLRCQGKDAKNTNKKVYYKDGKQLPNSNNLDSIKLNSVSRDNSKYHCTADRTTFLIPYEQTSKSLSIQVQELFPHPVLKASSSTPVEGSAMTLTCETQLSPQKPNVQLQFSFFRDSQTLGSGWSRSPKLQIPAMWTEDSGSYWCEAETVTHSVKKRSLRSQIHVQRVPVSNVNLEIQPTGGQLIEGENMVLICSVAQGSGNVTFSWHREGTVRSLGRKTQRSLLAELQVPTVKERDAGRYYCAADNVHGPILSTRIRVTVRIPVSYPVLTLRAPGPQAVVGDLLELHCEAPRGSPPILYQFYHENVTLGNSSAPSGGGASFNLSLRAEHSGNYSCDADNGLGAQRSHRVSLSIAGTSGNRTGLATAAVMGLLLSILGLAAAAALLHHARTRRKTGGPSATGTSSSNECQEPALSKSSRIDPQEPIHSEPLALMEPEPVYSNVNPEDSNQIYSQVWSIQHTKENSANCPRMHQKDEELTVLYSELKKIHPDDSARQASNRGRVHEDGEENYENVPCVSLASDH
ncbi:Fc receptor-like protein 3 isoform X1 [Sapajus apella]|uniref:Fc receptor-like protein 3 isoform X1 n=1 Tax=Sapajus apella TaxID=9515 RepID=A0A6J3GFM3_SAPAP|nr:Fc receptor-like protein 3 isoform X1 [Sapajus apella]